MKNVSKMPYLKNLVTLLVFSLFQLVVLAQDNSESSTTTTHESVKVGGSQSNSDWYAQPWVWIVGGAVFILLLIALLRGNSGSGASHTDKVSVTKTVSTDSDSGTV